MSTDYSSPSSPGPSRLKVTLPQLQDMAHRGDQIVMITAYDAPSARLADAAGVEIILVGDSAGTTALGGTSTVPVTMDEMLVYTRAAARGTTRALVVADMPFGSYQVSEESAVINAIRFVKEAGAEAVKLEGAGRTLTRISAIIDAGIPVMGHIGLTPQSATMQGGYKAQGRTAGAAKRLIDEAIALERSGCFAIVLEAIPEAVSQHITEAVKIPTIGIGAGRACSGQVLVWHDLLGLIPGPTPRFVKKYADIAGAISRALDAYVTDIRTRAFPTDQHTYGMPDAERQRMDEKIRK
ncbi:MAG TPA: 3-methyl-2-oxobutanoate hydroxymethyltransferase [Vicinamibacterales bacterium]|nr:3-methyl-2-oxobutanoate hydroxymethyltransferase [Vicinamibacterales bacterium]